ncbi:SH3 domain-containing protein [Vibrio parahaemolyticus]|uniref:SH3 domain-containing protein n=3 Tax=Vibrio parahaemolyticus TaxID=670 RepID=UPI0003DBFB90|nr:SH3 domain-containing protein [Vibrio parahaemolyticus]ETJ86935.1 bacterial SH3 domain protein [Vibrio parahaemolyticus 970107]MDF4674371.1 SH3 domain-containing protein [Vibrio parahaemolyticus]MDF4698622.1 SH3 domain-containing protein [Vibrio parahaemolyticus]
MSIKNCKQCGALLDGRAKTCEVCGTTQPQKKGYYLLVIILLVAFGWGVIFDSEQKYILEPKTASSIETLESAETKSFEPSYVIANELNVRLSPNTKGKITNVLYNGQLVHVFEYSNGWARISKYYDGSVEGFDGQVARWVSSEYLSNDKPVPTKSNPSNRLEAAIDDSDDYASYKTTFLSVSRELINSGICSIEDFEYQGGWIRSVNYKPRKVYFTYCGEHGKKSGRIYFEPSSGGVFR